MTKPRRSLESKGRSTNYVTTGGAGYVPDLSTNNIVEGVKSAGKNILNNVRQTLYNRIDPYSYDVGYAISQLVGKGRKTKKNDVYDALWARYLNRSNSDVGYNVDDYLQPATYKPNKGTPVGQIYRLTPKSWNGYDDLNPLGDIQLYEMLKSGKTSDLGDGVGGTKTGLGTYTRSLGQDEKGKYMSYYDEWDISPIGNKSGKEGKDQTFGIGTPFSVYDRRYYTDEEAAHIVSEYDKFYQSVKDAAKNQSIRHEIYSPKPYRNKEQNGGSINIAPSKRGSFTSAAAILRNKDNYFPDIINKKRSLKTGGYKSRRTFANGGGVHITVKKGDTLSKIAKRYTGNAMRYNELVKLNNITNPDLIEVGQDIFIPQEFVDTIKNNELSEVVVTGHKRQKKSIPRISLEEPKFNNSEQVNSLYVAPVQNRTKSIEDLNAPNFIESKLQDVKDVIRESGDIEDFIQTAWNGVAKHFVDDKQVKTQKRQLKTTRETPKEVLDEAFAKEIRNGTDTLTWDRVPVDRTGNKYYIQESYPITDDMRFGSRNRLEYRDLDSNNAPLTTYKPIYKYEDYIKGVNYNGKQYKAVDKDSDGHQNHFMGYDKDGKFKIGPLSKFGPGDTMTQVYYTDIIGVPRDSNGNIQYIEDRNNPGRFQPVVDVYEESTYDENGNLKRGAKGRSVLTTMSKKRSLDGSYGNVSGGRVLLQVGNETRIVAGSIEHVIQELELMQKNHKGKPVRYYQLDNGSYNRGLRTRNGKNISAQDLRDYDKQNTTSAGGGHFMYIRNKYSNGGSIYIAPSKKGTFTAAATKHGMSVQEFASRVLRNKENYSSAMVKKANFARNASKWNH